MEGSKAVARFIRVSPRKARLVVDLIRGKDLAKAQQILEYTPRDAARLVAKVLNSAAANAENNAKMNPDELFVATVYVDEGPTLKRFRPRAMGRATRINKRTSHITIILEEKVSAPKKKRRFRRRKPDAPVDKMKKVEEGEAKEEKLEEQAEGEKKREPGDKAKVAPKKAVPKKKAAEKKAAAKKAAPKKKAAAKKAAPKKAAPKKKAATKKAAPKKKAAAKKAAPKKKAAAKKAAPKKATDVDSRKQTEESSGGGNETDTEKGES